MAHPQQPPVPTSVLDGAVEDYPSDWKYWRVAIILFVLTAIEVSTYVLADSVFSDSRVLIATLLFLAFRYAQRLLQPLGETGTIVFLRLMAFILLCLGVQIVWDGVSELLRSL